ncbi:hypothetical protein BHM03_00058606 [Ensete ventricosum]|uniref:Uncharacterized protein n=1 Tax=Ensete ventricosum TaxID=4639 RepID=A0A445MMK4_ENSVE|nr:hypothetical protein BHM03_00058606 [Ensete ventricosum]
MSLPHPYSLPATAGTPYDTTASSLAATALAAAVAFNHTLATAPPCYHRFILLFNCCLICFLSQPLPVTPTPSAATIAPSL